MDNLQPLKHIVVQAGGSGTRMEWLTVNKPKALVPVAGEPMILCLMRLHKESKFYIIGDYKIKVLAEYLANFASKYNYQIFEAAGTGTCSGIQSAVDHIPSEEAFAVVWSDLYCRSRLYPRNISHEQNHIGLSNSFTCRWSYSKGKLLESASNEVGVAGVYIFKDKQALGEIPNTGEFCKYLQEANIKFDPYFLKDVHEVGTLEAYEKLTKDIPNSRPFNRMLIKDDQVIKEPISRQGENLAAREVNWYRALEDTGWSFIPKVIKYKPLTLERISGDNLFKFELTKDKKKQTLTSHIDNLKSIHSISAKVPKVDLRKNDEKAILSKTKKRLDSISNLIPYANDETITINGKDCLNFYKKWVEIEKIYQPYLGKSDYEFVHGDPTFSNTIYDPDGEKVYLIDPRGYYGDVELLGDPDYDWAKVYYSVVGNYDMFNLKKFRLGLSDGRVRLEIESSGWEDLEDYFFGKVGADKKKIKIMHAIIWLSLTTYTWDNYDSICAAFYNGIYLMQDLDK